MILKSTIKKAHERKDLNRDFPNSDHGANQVWHPRL